MIEKILNYSLNTIRTFDYPYVENSRYYPLPLTRNKFQMNIPECESQNFKIIRKKCRKISSYPQHRS